MRHGSFEKWLSVFSLAALQLGAQAQAVPSHQPGFAKESLPVAQYGDLPISFEANQGQTDKHFKFVARGSGYGIYLAGREAALALNAGTKKAQASEVVRMQLRGSNPYALASGVAPLPGTANYFIGKDAAKWQTKIPTYAKVKFSAVYPGVDLVYYGNQSQLEYDFVVAPQADPNSIRLQFAGACKLALSKAGDLTVSASHGKINFHKPVIYQETNGERQPVQGRFMLLADHSVGFTLGRYNHSQPLVIDPVLIYSSYLGGDAYYNGFYDGATAIAVDTQGNTYIAGFAQTPDFPVTPGAFQAVDNDGSGNDPASAYVSKLNAAGTALLYSTYLGGSGGDQATGIAVDLDGNAYITGSTASVNFPVTHGAFQTTNAAAGQSFTFNSFITKLNATGSALIYSTYLGGSANTVSNGIALDTSDNAYVTGATAATDFPVTPGAFLTKNPNGSTNPNGYGDGFVTKLNPSGSALVYSTYLGGSGGGSSNAVAVDSAGRAYVAGETSSSDFPVTPGAFQAANISDGNEAFVTRMNTTGSAQLYSTYLGGPYANPGNGNPGSIATGIAIDDNGDAFVTGSTSSSQFPVTEGAFQTSNAAPLYATNAFITKLNPNGTGLIYSTYLGGSGNGAPEPTGDSAFGIVIDKAGSAYVTGHAASANFPVTPSSFQTTNNNPSSYGNAFVTQLNSAGSALVYSTYLGGSGGDAAYAIAQDLQGTVYVAGVTSSTDFPVTPGAFLTSDPNIFGTGFVSRLAISPTAQPTTLTSTITTLTSDTNPQTVGQNVTFTATVAGLNTTDVPLGNVIFSVGGTPVATVPMGYSGNAIYETSALSVGTHPVRASYVGQGDFRPSSAIQFEKIIFPLIDFAPKSGTYNRQVFVTLTADPAGSTIYYTLDGSNPTTASTVYAGPIELTTGSTTILAREAVSGGDLSDVSEAVYTIQ